MLRRLHATFLPCGRTKKRAEYSPFPNGNARGLALLGVSALMGFPSVPRFIHKPIVALLLDRLTI